MDHFKEGVSVFMWSNAIESSEPGHEDDSAASGEYGSRTGSCVLTLVFPSCQSAPLLSYRCSSWTQLPLGSSGSITPRISTLYLNTQPGGSYQRFLYWFGLQRPVPLKSSVLWELCGQNHPARIKDDTCVSVKVYYE